MGVVIKNTTHHSNVITSSANALAIEYILLSFLASLYQGASLGGLGPTTSYKFSKKDMNPVQSGYSPHQAENDSRASDALCLHQADNIEVFLRVHVIILQDNTKI